MDPRSKNMLNEYNAMSFSACNSETHRETRFYRRQQFEMDLDPMFHFYYDGRGDVRNKFTLRKSQVTLERLAMIFKVFCYISGIYVTKKE